MQIFEILKNPDNYLDGIFILDEEELYPQIVEAANTDFQKFAENCASLPLGENSVLSIIYEALSFDENGNWIDFYLIEIGRVFKLAQKESSPYKATFPLGYIDIFNSTSDSQEKEERTFIEKVIKEFNNPIEGLRYRAIELLFDMVIEFDENEKFVISKVKPFLHDKSIRVRLLVYRLLKSLNEANNQEVKLSFFDRILGLFISLTPK